MRAHFAGDVVSGTSDDMLETDRIESEPLEARIDDFKRDSKNMEALTEFIDDVLQKAEAEAVKKQQELQGQKATKNGKGSQQPKEKSRQSFAIPDFKNGKVVNRARGLVVRIFDAICNCANTAAAAPAQRLKLRGKRSAANGSGSADGTADVTSASNTNKNEGDNDGNRDKQKKQGNSNGSGDGGYSGSGGKDKKIKESQDQE